MLSSSFILHPSSFRRTRRGSILIFVIALLTLIALVGTALVATSRVDRATSQVHVQNVSVTATRTQFQDSLRDKTLRAIIRGYGHDVDSARTDSWLGDRLPQQFAGTIPPVDGRINLSPLPWPMWRFTSGILDRYDPDLLNNAAWQPPHQYNPTSPETLLDTSTPAALAASPVKLDSTNLGLALIPHHLSITYPLDHPEELMRGKTRTFPAAYFVDRATNAVPAALIASNHALTSARPFLAASASGDGIADSLLFKLSPTPVDGVTYYGAVRIIDNNSAINVNTAYLRSSEVLGGLGNPLIQNNAAGINPAALLSSKAALAGYTGANNGFFTSDIGLYELLDPYKGYVKSNGSSAEGGSRPARDNELAELDEFRLGYPITNIDGDNDLGGWNDAFDDYSAPSILGARTRSTGTYPAIQPMFASLNNTGNGINPGALVAIEDRAQDPGDVTNAANTWNPDPDGSNTNDSIGNYSPLDTTAKSRFRPDFTFTTQNESLATMSSRRWESIRYGSDLRFSIDSSSTALNTATKRDALFPLATPENVDRTVGDYLFAKKPFNNTSQSEHALFPYRWLDETESAALAYHFLLINPRGTQSSLESALRHSAYRSAPNWKPTLSDGNPSWSSFPSNEYQYWFQFLNFDGTQPPAPLYTTSLGADPVTGAAYPNNSFLEQPSFADITLGGSSLTSSFGGQPRFRPIRTLLTTHNPVNTTYIAPSYLYANEFAFKHASNNNTFTGIDWNRDATGSKATESSMVYPGMILNDMLNLTANKYRVPEPWNAGTQYMLNDLVYLKDSRITYMCIRDYTGSTGVDPSSAANFDTLTGEPLYWEPQQWVSGHTKASVNTAGFPELWRAYFNVIASGSVSATSPDDNLKTEIDALTSAAPNIAPPNKLRSDDYAFFPLTASDPLTPGALNGADVSAPDAFYLRFYDPYRGMRFHILDTTGSIVNSATGLPAGPGTNDPTFDPAIANQPEINNIGSASPTYETNKLGMFRSVIRDPRPIRPVLTAPADTANPDEYIQLSDVNHPVTAGSLTVATATIQGTGAPAQSPQERLTPFQMATLRSAIAAFNTQDMLNTSGLMENTRTGTYNVNDIPAKTVILYDTTREFPNPTPNGAEPKDGTTPYPGADSPRPQYEVTIYANRPQLFITEVFASNDSFAYDFVDNFPATNDVDPSDSSKVARKRYQNPNGYVAIELHNPYPVDVNTAGWRISSIDRRSTGGSFGTAAHQLGGPGGARSIDISGIGIVPANGYVVLESYETGNISTDKQLNDTDPYDLGKQPYGQRQYRPPASGIAPLYDKNADDSKEDTIWHWKKKAPSYPSPEAPASLDANDHSQPLKPILNIRSIPLLTDFLTAANGQELVILRPRTLVLPPAPPATTLEDMVPVDQFDFTGMPGPSNGPCKSIHYARNTLTNNWSCVYPGRYDGFRSDYSALQRDIGPRRHQGTWVTPPLALGGAPEYTPGAAVIDPWISPAYRTNVGPGPFVAAAATARYGAMTFGFTNARAGANLTTINFTPALAGTQLVQNISIPLLGYPLAYNPLITTAAVAQTKIQHPSAPIAQTTNQFPFGGFARNGDILQVPFIAAYRIRKFQSADASDVPTSATGVAGVNPGHLDPAYVRTADNVGNIIEMNSISMDAAFAEDTNPLNDIAAPTPDTVASGASPVPVESVGRLSPRASNVTPNAYSFASNLFRYLDVHVPAADYLPDTNPAIYPPGSPLTNAAANTKQLPKAVNNRPGVPNMNIDPGTSGLTSQATLQSVRPTDEDGTSVQGLINLNTAPRKVLSMLPIVPNAAGGIDVAANDLAAQNIFNYVSGTVANTGDIKTLFDLNKIPGIQGLLPYAADFSKLGDPYPIYAGAAGTTSVDPNIGTLKQQYLLMNRISNLVTTKSDTFTVYLLVQGWREAGTQFPVLDWEQRQAYIVDRSTGTLRVTKVPTD